MIRLPALAASLLLTLALPVGGSGQVVPTRSEAETRASQEPPGRVRGRVFGRHGSVAGVLPNAMVTLSSEGRHRSTITGPGGTYLVEDLPPGTWQIRVLHVGYEDITAAVRIPPEGTVDLDLELRWEPVSLPPLLIRGDPLHGRPQSQIPASEADLGELALRALEASPGMVEAGLAEVVRSLPGHDPADPTDVILMRGSASDLKLVLLDGAPIYTPFHMAGLVESFDPLALGEASLFLGGAPARFDGGLSYILDLTSRSPRQDRIHGRVGADLMTSRLLLEGPVAPGVGFLLGSRALHELGAPLLGKDPSPYGYGDLLGRLEWTRGEEGEDGGLFLSGFWNTESVALDLLSPAAEELAQNNNEGFDSFFGGPAPGEGARWGNRALSAGLWGTSGDTRVELRGALSRYDAQLPVGDTLPLFASGRTDRARLTADVARPWGGGFLRFGASLDRQRSTYTAVALEGEEQGPPTRFRVQGTTGGGYVEAGRPITGDVTLKGGIRVDRFEGDSDIKIAPRLSVAWALTDNAVLTLAAGRYHQFATLTSEEVERTLEGPDSDSTFTRGPPFLRVGSANHLVVSLDQILTPSLRLGLEGFVKDFSGIPGVDSRELNASGVDLRVAREGDRAAGWLGYTLTWFWASGDPLGSGNSPFSGRHLLSAGFSTRLTERTGIRIRASYGDGLPYTAIALSASEDAGSPSLGRAEPPVLETVADNVVNAAPELIAGPDEGFLRVDAELYGLWTPSFGGRPMELRPYLRVLNALNRRDALFYHFEPWRSPVPEPLADLPLLPLLGLEWRF